MHLDELSHSYTQDGVKYQSVTQLVSKFKVPFKRDMIAGIVAKKQGREIEDVIREWELKAELARDFGNAVHKSIELYIKYGEKPKHKFLLKVVNEFAKLKTGKLHSEIVVYSDELKTAGKLDIIESLGDKKIVIPDLKTNGEMVKKAYGKFLPPFDYLEQTSINEYRLQLSAYKHLMELKGYDVVGLELLHYTNKFEIINIDPIENIADLWE